MDKAVFMDRDGTVNEEVGYMYHAGLYRPFPWTGAAVRLINESGMKAILVTNQSGIGRGYFSEASVNEVHGLLKQELARWDAHLDAVYFCPHVPDTCECRKPKPGMLLQAGRDFDLDLTKSYMIGDRYLDIQMAQAVGARGILVLTGDGPAELEKRQLEEIQPQFVAPDLRAAVEAILNGEVNGQSS